MLFNPTEFFKNCQECKTYIMVDGKPHKNVQTGEKIKRREGEKPNCKICPKSSMTMLSQENWKTWHIYQKHKHLGLEDQEKKDGLIQRHMVLIGEIESIAIARNNPLRSLYG